MADDVLINKSATVERCVVRAREEYGHDPASFATDFTRQDAAKVWVCPKAHAMFLS